MLRMFFSKRGIYLVMFILLVSSVSAMDDLMALQGQVNDLNGDPVYGNITVRVYDSSMGGNLVYDSGDDFNERINRGQYDLMLGSGSNKMNLTFGQRYFIDLEINGEDIDFDDSERFEFQSSTGTVKKINLSGDNLTIMDGNVGIGTASPNSKFHIDNGNIRITNSNQGYNEGFIAGVQADGEVYLQNNENTELFLRSNGYRALNIEPDGDVQIPYRLDIGLERVSDSKYKSSWTGGDSISVTCPSGKNLLGGGCYCSRGTPENCNILRDWPQGTLNTWTCYAYSTSSYDLTLTAYALCGRIF